MTTPARTAADLLGLSRNTVSLLDLELHGIIAARSAEEARLDGEVEVDESTFGGRRQGKKGRGAGGPGDFIDAARVRGDRSSPPLSGFRPA